MDGKLLLPQSLFLGMFCGFSSPLIQLPPNRSNLIPLFGRAFALFMARPMIHADFPGNADASDNQQHQQQDEFG
jgi:hypothetical protein